MFETFGLEFRVKTDFVIDPKFKTLNSKETQKGRNSKL